MKMDLQQFVHKFSNMDGVTLSEKRKNFGFLLRSIPEDHDTLIALITPTNFLENVFKLNLLLKLQRTPELLEILKTGEEDLQYKLLKNKWFCKKLALLLDENSTGFVDGILPCTSYLIRNRIIRILASHGQNLDQVYDEICTRYGIHIASNLLVGCSEAKIQHILTNSKISLSVRNQKILFHKYPHLFLLYCERGNCLDTDDSVTRYIARNDINYFLKLVQDTNFLTGTLGKRLTKKLVKNFKEIVIADSGNLSNHLRIKSVIKMLNLDDLNQFVLNCSPRTYQEFPSSISDGFSNLRKALGKHYYEHLKNILQTKYNKSIYDCSKLINKTMMQDMVLEEREKWIKIKKGKGKSENDLIPFMNVTKAIQIIKNKINVTSSISDRKKLVQLLAKTCKINNNLNALAGVCEYVCTRHRNDNSEVIANFLSTLQYLFELEKLKESHWQSINKLMEIYTRKNPDCYLKCEFYDKEIIYLYLNKKLTDDKIFDYLKLQTTVRHWCYNEPNFKELEKILLLKRIDVAPQLVAKDDVLEYYDLMLIHDIFKWNRNNVADRISIFAYPRLIESLKKCVKDSLEIDSYKHELEPLKKIFRNIICVESHSEFREEVIKIYFSVGFRFYNLKVDFWLLKNQPGVIIANFNMFLEHLFTGDSPDIKILNYILKYLNSEIRNKVIQYALKLMSIKKHPEIIFPALAVLEESNIFLQHIVPFYPSNNKYEDIEDSKLADMSVAVAKSFKYTTSDIVFPTLMSYCKGDFLRYALEALYYRFYHTPENQLSIFLNQLSSKAVSVRKHSIFLSCIVANVSDVKTLFTRFTKTEKNVSAQKHLFTAALKYFVKNPSDDFWEYVKICMTKLNKNDRESFDLLLDVEEIPENYRFQHVIFVWEILKKSRKSQRNQLRLISSIPQDIFKDFPLNFLMEVINTHFLKLDCRDDEINDFVSNCLTRSLFQQEILAAFVSLVRQSIPFPDLQTEKKFLHLIRNFVNLISHVVTSEENFDLLGYFVRDCEGLFPATKYLRIHLKVTLTMLFLKSEKDMVKFTPNILQFLDTLTNSYGLAVIDCFASEIKEALEVFIPYDESDEAFLNFCLNLCRTSPNIRVYMFVLKLLPTTQPTEDDPRRIFEEIVELLRQVPEKSIQMLTNTFIMDME